MGVFNYSKFHYFDKEGNELILSHKPCVRINIINDNIPEFYAEYALVKSTPDDVDLATNSSLLQIKSGMRFNIKEGTTLRVHTSVADTNANEKHAQDSSLRSETYELKEYDSAFGKENYPYPIYNDSSVEIRRATLGKNNLSLDSSVNFFPSYTFSTRIEFDKVSTGLVETQTIYVLVDDDYEMEKNGTGKMVPVAEYASHYDDVVESYNNCYDKINDLQKKISEIDAKISDLDTLLADKLIEIYSLKDEKTTLEEEKVYQKKELDRILEETGILDTQILENISNIDRRIDEINRKIADIYASDPKNFELMNDYMALKSATEAELDEANENVITLKNKIDYFKSVKDYIERFKLLFFIDCREQKDFRMFDVKYDEMTWNDRKFIDFNAKSEDGCNDNGFSANIGFSGENDGVYEHTLYVCLVDCDNKENSDLGEVYPIGEVLMSCETEGEDERYRTLFDNFGIPDPKYYNDIFIDSDINNDSPDYISINKNSKKMFLAYNDIFPYIGSYKGLLNAIKTLGYEDEIFFKEWYKEIGKSSIDDGGYITYEISFKDTSNQNVISNLDISERIHLRKMNWLSMIYKINEELDKPEDKWGFPSVITNYKNFNTERLAKILSLKDWLEKYAIGVNCHITDVGGEGLVFERYNLQKYGTYQTVFEYDNEKAISAVVSQEYVTLNNGSANIDVDIHTTDKDVMIDEMYNSRFIDLCDGYFDQDNIYHDVTFDLEDNEKYVYFGKCFDLHDNINTLEIRTRGKHSSYKFGKRFIDEYSPSLIVDDDRIFFDYYQCFRKYKNTAFTNPPVIQIEKGVIKKFSKSGENIGEKEYYASISPHIKNESTYYRVDVKYNKFGDPKIYDVSEVPTFVPPSQGVDIKKFILIRPSINNKLYKYLIYAKCDDLSGEILICTVKKDGTILTQDLTDIFVVDDNGNKMRADAIVDEIKRHPQILYEHNDGKEYIRLNPLSYTSKISNDTKIKRYKNNKYNEDGYYNINGNTYGLRYCTDNANNIPCFKMLGYEEKRMLFSNEHIRFPYTDNTNEGEGIEYMVEIINGRMIFNDTENNSVITLNFVYDENEKHQYIYVNTFKESEMSSMYKYKISSTETTSRFLPSDSYDYFVKGYKSIVNAYVEYDGSKSVNVNNIGEYTIDAVLYDESNNIFAKRSSRKVNVLPQFADASIFGSESNSGFPYNNISDTASTDTLYNIFDIFNNKEYGVGECVFEHTPKLQISNIENNKLKYYGKASDKSSNTGTNSIENKKSSSKLMLSSMSDRYEIMKYMPESNIFRLAKTSGYYAHMGVYDLTSFLNTIKAYSINQTSIENYLLELRRKSESSKNGSFVDVTLYVYDEVCEYPIFSIPGVMIPDVLHQEDDIYDEYLFTPIQSSKTDASTLAEKLNSYCSGNDAPRLAYYIIPQWAIPCTINTISQENNVIDISLNNSIFSSAMYGRYRLKDGRMMTLFYNTNDSDYFGKGSYMLKAQQNAINYTLYTYLGQRRRGESEQSGFDGSTWFAPPSLDYMTYDCDVDVNESDNQSNSLSIVNNTKYRYAQKFIDQNYSVSLRNFDPNDAIEIWEYNSDDYSTYNQIKGKYVHTTPITTTMPYVEILPHIPGYINDISTMTSNSMTVRWKIYIRYGNSSRKLIMECFNKALFLKLKDYGTYDIEMTLWDQYGNKFEKKMNGYITYKKEAI